MQSEAGLVSITGTPDTPSKVGLSIADIAGGMYAYSGILTALLQRQRTGEGAALDVSLFESLGEWMGYAMYYTMGGEAPARTGASHATIAPYGPYSTSDGQVIFGVQNDREWGVFCAQVLRRPDIAEDARFQGNQLRVQNRVAMDVEINGILGALPTAEAVSRLDAAQIANARINSVEQFIGHPAARRPSGVAAGGLATRTDSRAPATRAHVGRRPRHGCGSRPRAALGSRPRRARLRRRHDCAVETGRRHLNVERSREGARPPARARAAVLSWGDTFPLVDSSSSVMLSAVELAITHRLGIWDALILSAAADAGCRLLLSEDLQDGFTWSGVTVANPFAATRHPLLDAVLREGRRD